MSPRYHVNYRPESVSLVVPAVRMVAVGPRTKGDEQGTATYPVVASQVSICDLYMIRAGASVSGNYRSHEDYLEAGWSPDEREIVREPLVVFQGRLFTMTDAFGGGSEDSTLVVCTWPPEEDEVRLASAIKEIEAGAAFRRSLGSVEDNEPRGGP